MALHRLIFDTAAPAESANVGAYLRSADGTLLTHTTVGGSEALDVNVVALTASDIDIRDLVFATDKVDVSGSAVSITGDVNVTQGTSPWVVSATDLDIRDLSHTQDSVKIGDGTDFLAVAADGSIAVTDNGASLTVDAVNLDIRDLVAATDSVAAYLKDGAGTSITSTLTGGKQAVDVNLAGSDVALSVSDIANVAVDAAAEAVTTTSAALITSVLANRKYLSLYNHGSKVVYVGPSGVAVADGFPIFPGSIMEMRLGAAVTLHAVSQSGTQDVRVLQAS